MSYVDWKSHGDETVAAYLPAEALKGVLEKRIAVPPDCAAIVIRDGKVVESLIGAHLSFGGLWQSFKQAIGGKHAIRVLVADLKPFQVLAGLEAFTRDKVEIQAELVLELAVNPEKAHDIMGLMADGPTLVRDDVHARIRPLVQERVLFKEIMTHDAAELRANSGLQDRIQAELMKEVERVVGDLGLLVRASSVNWGLNEEEAQQIRQRTLQRDEEMAQFNFERAKRDLERETQSTILKITSTQDIARLDLNNASELTKLLLTNAIDIEDTRTTGQRVEQYKALRHELDQAQARRNAIYEDRLANATSELDTRRIELNKRRDETAFDQEVRRANLEFRKIEQLQELELKRASQVQDLEIKKTGQFQDLDVAGATHDLNARRLRDLQELELAKERAIRGLNKEDFTTQHNADMDRRMQSTQAELDKLKLQSTMTPDHILALQAGASPEVARVFSERARTVGADKEALLREMLDMSKNSKVDSERQAGEMFDRAVDALARVGAARGRGERGGDDDGDSDAKVECPKCHFKNPVKNRFCKNCGQQLRT